MARPKSERQGRSISLYLSPEELDHLGANPANKIKTMLHNALQAANEAHSEPTPPAEENASPRPVPKAMPSTVMVMKKTPHDYSQCPDGRCERIGKPSCPYCRAKNGMTPV